MAATAAVACMTCPRLLFFCAAVAMWRPLLRLAGARAQGGHFSFRGWRPAFDF